MTWWTRCVDWLRWRWRWRKMLEARLLLLVQQVDDLRKDAGMLPRLEPTPVRADCGCQTVMVIFDGKYRICPACHERHRRKWDRKYAAFGAN